MQVRKFEASSMKEALDMVKTEMGPDAIILSANENKSFGLLGRGSVEVTAAVSETQLKKREFARKHLRQDDAEKFGSASARAQKRFIEKSLNRFSRDESAEAMRSLRYVDIEDDKNQSDVRSVDANKGRRVESVISDINEKKSKAYSRSAGKLRVQEAVQSALSAVRETESHTEASYGAPRETPQAKSREVSALKTEIQALKEMLFEIQSAPRESFSVHPGADRGIPFELSATYSNLTDVGIDPDYVTEMLQECKQQVGEERLKNRAMIQAWLAKYFLNTIQIADKGYESKFHVFVGPSAQGKTSSLVKYASHLILNKKKRVAIVSCDTERIGGYEQLKILSKILNAPFEVAYKSTDWIEVFEKYNAFDYVLIDMPSARFKNKENLAAFRDRLPPARVSMDMHYVISSHWRSKEAYENLSSYISLGIKDLIVTKLDEVSQHGLVFNLQKRFGLPLHSFGTGDQMPGDFEFATKERLIDLLLKITKGTHGGVENDRGV